MTIHIGQNFASGVIALVLMIGYFYAASIWNARATHKQNWLMVILFSIGMLVFWFGWFWIVQMIAEKL
jgi:hypothetical protein